MTQVKSNQFWSENFLPASKQDMQRRVWPIFLGLGYILAIYLLGGLKLRHVFIGLLGFLDIYNFRTRSFLKYFFPFILTGVVYDSMRYYYWWGVTGHIHVAEPYHLEKKLFGINTVVDGVQKLVTPNEYFQDRTSVIVDFFCGFAYLTFVAEYLGTGFLLYFTRRFEMLKVFGWCFCIVNVIGFMTYYIYPAAPPWYVSQFGLGPARLDVHATPAAAVRFDYIFGTHFFDGMYAQSNDVYGALPSLHVAYPFLVAWVALVSKRFRIPAILFYLLMCFSAVYLQHHYILDIILGTIYSIIVLYFVTRYHGKKIFGSNWSRSSALI